MKLARILTCILLLQLYAAVSNAAPTNGIFSHEEYTKLLKELDEVIAHKQEYRDLRKAHIDSLVAAEKVAPANDRYRLWTELYQENANYDGRAALYWLKAIEKASPYDRETLALVHIRRSKIFTMMGLYHRASAEVTPLEKDITSYSAEVQVEFYDAILNAIYWISKTFKGEFALSEADREARRGLYDVQLGLKTKGTTDYMFCKVSSLIQKNEYDEALSLLNVLETKAEGQELIYVDAVRADIYEAINDNQRAALYLAKTSIADLKNGITEYMALPLLVKYVYMDGDYDRAYRYLLCCMEDQDLYPASFLNMHSGTIFPVITRARNEYLEERQGLFVVKIITAALSLLAIVALVFLTIIIRNHRTHIKELSLHKDLLTEANKNLEKANLDLEKANERLQRANETKDSFLNNMSHELRTPLNAIQGFSEIMVDEQSMADSAVRQQVVNVIRQNTQHLTQLIDDAMELASFDSENTQPEMQTVTVPTLIDHIIVESTSMLENGVEFVRDIRVADDQTIQTNERMAHHALRSLMSNACKFTKQGTITVSCYKEDDNIVVAIADTGCGIPPSKEEYIFERFTKLDAFVPGTGLGLPMCRVIAEKIGANVMLDTTYTSGARFVMLFPA